MNIPDGVSTTWWVGRISDICFQFNASKLEKMIRISQHQSSGCESACSQGANSRRHEAYEFESKLGKDH